MKILSLVSIIFTILILQGCNNNPEDEPPEAVPVEKVYPLISNADFREKPIISTKLYPQRRIIITSSTELGILPSTYLKDNPGLMETDFQNNSIVAYAVISNEIFTGFTSKILHYKSQNLTNIYLTFNARGESDILNEWVAVFECRHLPNSDIQIFRSTNETEP